MAAAQLGPTDGARNHTRADYLTHAEVTPDSLLGWMGSLPPLLWGHSCRSGYCGGAYCYSCYAVRLNGAVAHEPVYLL